MSPIIRWSEVLVALPLPEDTPLPITGRRFADVSAEELLTAYLDRSSQGGREEGVPGPPAFTRQTLPPLPFFEEADDD